MKKRVVLIFTMIMLIMNGCGNSCEHQTLETNISYDLFDHWYKCSDCQKKTAKENHQFNDEGLCEKCNTKIIDEQELEHYDEVGLLERSVSYIHRYRRRGYDVLEEKQYEYDDKGLLKTVKTYWEGDLFSVENYLPLSNDVNKVYVESDIYYDDIYKEETHTTYDEDGEMIQTIVYDKNQNIIEELVYSHQVKYDDEGNITKTITYANDKLYCETTYYIDENGDLCIKEYIEYDEDGNVCEKW